MRLVVLTALLLSACSAVETQGGACIVAERHATIKASTDGKVAQPAILAAGAITATLSAPAGTNISLCVW
jgi:hypothetical protein